MSPDLVVAKDLEAALGEIRRRRQQAETVLEKDVERQLRGLRSSGEAFDHVLANQQGERLGAEPLGLDAAAVQPLLEVVSHEVIDVVRAAVADRFDQRLDFEWADVE